MTPPPCTCRAVQVPSRGPGPRFVVEHCKLHAAAPKLLAVVEELEESSAYWSDYDVPLGIVDRIRAALTEAKGQT